MNNETRQLSARVILLTYIKLKEKFGKLKMGDKGIDGVGKIMPDPWLISSILFLTMPLRLILLTWLFHSKHHKVYFPKILIDLYTNGFNKRIS